MAFPGTQIGKRRKLADDKNNYENEEDLSRQGFTQFPEEHMSAAQHRNVTRLQLHHNRIGFIPPSIGLFSSLIVLDVSNNNISHIADEICELRCLQTFVAKNNCLDDGSLPKSFVQLTSIQAINLGGNQFTEFPIQLVSLYNMVELHLGSNKIRSVPESIQRLQL